MSHLLGRLALLACAAWVSGCTSAVDRLCEELSGECPEATYGYALDRNECVEDGEALEDAACDADCGDYFDNYIECLERERCNWNTHCITTRKALDGCIANR